MGVFDLASNVSEGIDIIEGMKTASQINYLKEFGTPQPFSMQLNGIECERYELFICAAHRGI